jgi:polyisoprenoid-binding protein YceI
MLTTAMSTADEAKGATMSTGTTGQPDIESIRWRLDPTRSSVEFHARTFWGLATVKGRFERYEGTLALSDTPAVVLQIEAASLDTKNARRDKHLRSSDFFDVENHPQVRFVSDSATLDGERLQVRGQLHAAGTSMPLELNATLRPNGDDLQLEAETHADHHQLGMTWNRLGMMKTPSRLIVHGRLVPDAGTSSIS